MNQLDESVLSKYECIAVDIIDQVAFGATNDEIAIYLDVKYKVVLNNLDEIIASCDNFISFYEAVPLIMKGL